MRKKRLCHTSSKVKYSTTPPILKVAVDASQWTHHFLAIFNGGNIGGTGLVGFVEVFP